MSRWEKLKIYFKNYWADEDTVYQMVDWTEDSLYAQKQSTPGMEKPKEIQVPASCNHRIIHSDCISCHRKAYTKADMVLYVVTDSRGHLPTSKVLGLASKLSKKMEDIQRADPEAKWGPGLAAEAVFDLARIDKNPLPTHYHVLRDEEMTHVPTIIKDIMGISGGAARRLLSSGSVKLDGYKLLGENVSTTRLHQATLVVGKQGTAIFCHHGLEKENV